MDPITFTIMEDPVMLPHSKQIMDRNNIGKSQYLKTL